MLRGCVWKRAVAEAGGMDMNICYTCDQDCVENEFAHFSHSLSSRIELMIGAVIKAESEMRKNRSSVVCNEIQKD